MILTNRNHTYYSQPTHLTVLGTLDPRGYAQPRFCNSSSLLNAITQTPITSDSALVTTLTNSWRHSLSCNCKSCTVRESSILISVASAYNGARVNLLRLLNTNESEKVMVPLAALRLLQSLFTTFGHSSIPPLSKRARNS